MSEPRRVGDRQVRIIRTPVGTRIEEIPDVELEPEQPFPAEDAPMSDELIHERIQQTQRGERTRRFQTHRAAPSPTGQYPTVPGRGPLRRRRPHWLPLAVALLALIMSSTFWAYMVPLAALDWRKLAAMALMVLSGGYVCWHMDRLAQWTKGTRD